MTLLIDADVVAFRCAASAEPTKIKPYREPIEMAIRRAEELIYRIFADMNTDNYKGFLTGKGNFRKVIDPSYKANRTKPEPAYLQDLRQYMILDWKMEVVDGIEADDAIGMASTEDTIICSNDKDLRQIPGGFYNFTVNKFEVIDEITAAQVPYSLMLIGDSTDNISGVDRIGKKTAAKIIQEYGDDIDGLKKRVQELYNDDERFYRNLLLVKVLRSEAELKTINDLVKTLNEDFEREVEKQFETIEQVSSL